MIQTTTPHAHLHARSGAAGAGHQADDNAYYHGVVEALAGAKEILVVGPGQAKVHLIKHIHAHDPLLADKVVGVETVDHPTDGQLVAYARKYFVAKERMLS